VVALLFHRGRNRTAHYTHGNRPRDRLPALIAGALVLFGIDAVALVRSTARLREGMWRYPDGDPLATRIEVTAQQWAWTFRYPGADGLFETPDDIVTLNDLRVPIGKPVYVQLTSKDVIHSMYLPNFRTKIDAVPGTITRMWFQPTEVGVYEIGCAQHCGAWHYKMRGELTVLSSEDFARWQVRAAADAALRYQPSDAETTQSRSDGWPWKPAP
jgi:cytochrome c oxidase subunit II